MKESKAQGGGMSRPVALGILLALAVLVAMGRIATHDFTDWDDPQTLHHNPRLNPPSFGSIAWYWGWQWGEHHVPWKEGKARIPLPHTEMDIYIPVTHMVWGMLASAAYMETPDEQGIHLNPWIFHAASVVVHVLTALVVFAILRRIIGNDWAALAGAMLYGLHPVQVETVAWASGMKDLLCGLFGALAVWQYVEFASPSLGALQEGRVRIVGSALRTIDSPRSAVRNLHEPSPGVPGEARRERRRKCLHFSLATMAFVLALLSKPSAVVLPLLAGVIDLLIIRRPIRKVALALAPWLVLSFACAVIARLVQPATGVEVTAWWTRPFIVADALAFYLYKLVLPLWLAPDYGRRPAVVMGGMGVWVVWVVPTALAVLLWKVRQNHPQLLAAGLLFVLALAPVLGLTPFLFQYYSTTADHYLYLAMLGPAVALAWAVHRFSSRTLAIGVSIWLAVLGICSMLQAGHWQDSQTLWQHTVEVNPRSFTGWMNLGNALARKGQAALAGQCYQRSLSIKPDVPRIHDNLAIWFMGQGKADEAIDHMRQSLRLSDNYPPRIRPDNSTKHLNVGKMLIERKRYAEAVEELKLALQQRPGNDEAARALAVAEERSIETRRQGDPGTRREEGR